MKSMVFCAVSGGVVSLVQGSYEYYHYLQDGFDDSVCLLPSIYSHCFKKPKVSLDVFFPSDVRCKP